MLLLLRFYVFYVFLKIEKNVTFYVFLPCFTRFLELCLPTADNAVPARPSRRVGVFDQATTTSANTSPPTSSSKLRAPSVYSTQTDSHQHHQHHQHRQVLFQQPPPQQQKSQHGSVVMCENGICRLRAVTSHKQCHDVRSFATYHSPTAATDLLSTTVRDAKSVRSLRYPDLSYLGLFVPGTMRKDVLRYKAQTHISVKDIFNAERCLLTQRSVLNVKQYAYPFRH